MAASTYTQAPALVPDVTLAATVAEPRAEGRGCGGPSIADSGVPRDREEGEGGGRDRGSGERLSANY